jgi:steroid 5-alpha reductase family enzyme
MRMGFNRLDSLGVLCWLVALAGESAADRQLARFKADPANRGRVCREGLWRYSRHPNYFFEWIHWWAYVFLAVGSPHWWLAPFGVVAMLVFLTLVSGIPRSEAQALKSRGAGYREYQRTTSAFLPWFPG